MSAFKTLFIGDLHIQQNNLEDSSLLFDYIQEILDNDKEIRILCFLGDIFHTHSIVKQEPAFFVRKQIEKIKGKYQNQDRSFFIYALAGNHDYSSPSASYVDNAVRLVLGDLIDVVDDAPCTHGPFTFLPFIGDNVKFIETSKKISSDQILVCHQTFDGSKYETNTTAANGVDQNLIPQKLIISGHIHTFQMLENQHNSVWYVGTPRALTANECNIEKFLTVYDPETKKTDLYTTNHLVKCWKVFHINQDSGDENLKINVESKKKDDVRIYVTGNEEFYLKVLSENSHLEGVARFIPDIRKEKKRALQTEMGSHSLGDALHEYVHKVYDIDDELRKRVWQKLQTVVPALGNKI